MKLADVHVHSTFSFDGSSTMEEQCEQAVKEGISVICFTDHVDFNTLEKNVGKTKDNTIQNFNVVDYLEGIERLKKVYSSLEILSGIEFSEPHLYPREFDVYQKQPFDYILGSIHHCYNSVFPGAANLSEKQAIEEYYDIMMNSIRNCVFQAIAHIDFPRRYFDHWNVDRIMMDDLLRLIIKKQIVLEINTSSISKGEFEPMPRYSIIQRYVELGGKRVVLGSDAHTSSVVGCGFKSVIESIPKELEIGYFKKRIFIPLSKV